MRHVWTVLIALALAAFPGKDTAFAAAIEGSWKGKGTARLTSGEVEGLLCRIRYEKSTGKTFVLHITCAHSNGIFEVSGRIVRLGASRYSGHLYSEQHSVSGKVNISVSGNRQTLKATSANGSATVILTRQ